MEQEEKILTREIVKELGLDKVDVITSDMLEGYTEIGFNAFTNCTHLTFITIPNSVTSIGYEAFAYCSAIKSITIPNSVTSIGTGAFVGCFSLTSITIPNSVTKIKTDVFEGCSSLTSITIPNSVAIIGYCAFGKCTKLDSVTIGNEIYETQKVFDGKCKAYKAFYADLTCRGFRYKEGKTYEVKGEPKICLRGFHACLNLTDVFNYYFGEFGKDIVVHEVELEGVSEERRDDSKIVAKKITIGKRIL